MHIDEQKKFDIRNIERNIKAGILTQKDYETYLSKLPNVSEKAFNPEEAEMETDEAEPKLGGDVAPKRKQTKKKTKSKAK